MSDSSKSPLVQAAYILPLISFWLYTATTTYTSAYIQSFSAELHWFNPSLTQLLVFSRYALLYSIIQGILIVLLLNILVKANVYLWSAILVLYAMLTLLIIFSEYQSKEFFSGKGGITFANVSISIVVIFGLPILGRILAHKFDVAFDEEDLFEPVSIFTMFIILMVNSVLFMPGLGRVSAHMSVTAGNDDSDIKRSYIENGEMPVSILFSDGQAVLLAVGSSDKLRYLFLDTGLDIELELFTGANDYHPSQEVVVTRSRINQLQEMISSYILLNKGLPDSLMVMRNEGALTQDFIDNIFLDGWGNQIQYEIAGDSYILRSYGADNQPNTDDDVLIAFRSDMKSN